MPADEIDARLEVEEWKGRRILVEFDLKEA